MASDIGLDAASWRFDAQQRLVITERSGRDWISWGVSELHNGIGAEQEE